MGHPSRTLQYSRSKTNLPRVLAPYWYLVVSLDTSPQWMLNWLTECSVRLSLSGGTGGVDPSTGSCLVFLSDLALGRTDMVQEMDARATRTSID